eukprot:scaffold14398_cov83-Phaeocystis_antarctica.AAC.5
MPVRTLRGVCACACLWVCVRGSGAGGRSAVPFALHSRRTLSLATLQESLERPVTTAKTPAPTGPRNPLHWLPIFPARRRRVRQYDKG